MELTTAEMNFIHACFREQEEQTCYKNNYVKPKYQVRDFCSDSENVLKTVLLRGLKFRVDSSCLRWLVKRIMFLARKWEFREQVENAKAELFRLSAFGGKGDAPSRQAKSAIATELAHIFVAFRMPNPSTKTADVALTDVVFQQTLRIRNALKMCKKYRDLEKRARMARAVAKAAERPKNLEVGDMAYREPVYANIKGPNQRVRDPNAAWHGGNVSGKSSWVAKKGFY